LLYFENDLLESMDYLKKSLSKLNIKKDYEEIDSRLASGWYVDSTGPKKVKKYKTNKITYKISKKV
tara:strand:+ start:186 stop:383 length:198 start_codon:yes stop_codon:yes gene_type:complete